MGVATAKRTRAEIKATLMRAWIQASDRVSFALYCDYFTAEKRNFAIAMIDFNHQHYRGCRARLEFFIDKRPSQSLLALYCAASAKPMSHKQRRKKYEKQRGSDYSGVLAMAQGYKLSCQKSTSGQYSRPRFNPSGARAVLIATPM